MSAFLQALKVQRRVIHAFILRETRTRFGRSKLGYFWAFFEPLAYILTLVSIFSAIGRSAPIPVDITLFFFSGIIPWLMFAKCVTIVSGAAEANKTLLSYPQVKMMDVVLARVILEFSTLFLVALIYLTTVVFWLNVAVKIESILSVIIALLTATLIGSGFGLIGATIKLYMPSYSTFQATFMRVLFFTSGIFFVVESLPTDFQKWLYYNPVAHVLEWTRSSFFTSFESNFYNILYPVAMALILLFIGMLLERASRRKLQEV